MAGNFDFLHIKRRTAGSSNELSLDVLDHKSVEAADKAARSSKLPKPPKASQGSYTGVGSTSTLIGREEVEKRKKARRASRLRLRAVLVVALIGLVAFGVYAGIRFHDERVNYTSRAQSLIDRLSDVDEVLTDIDVLMGDPFNQEQLQKRSRAVECMPSMTTELNRIAVDAKSLLEMPIDQETQVAVTQVDKAARSRATMVAAARDAFDLSAEAAAQTERSNKLWGEVLNASQLAREAISASNKATTAEALAAARDDTQESLDALKTLLGELREQSKTYGIDFTAQEAFLEKKIESLDWAIAIDEAILAKDRGKVVQAADAYNAADAEATQLASALPPSAGDAVQDRFRESMAGISDRYEKAREETVESDAMIRDYLQHTHVRVV